MKLINFRFNKINIERLSEKVEKLNLKSDLNISSINEIDSNLSKTKDKILKIDFIHNLNYEPNFAKLEFKGSVFVSIDSSEAENTLKNWKNNKIPETFKTNLFNIILRKISVKALELEEELGLPLHIPMPKVQQNTEKK